MGWNAQITWDGPHSCMQLLVSLKILLLLFVVEHRFTGNKAKCCDLLLKVGADPEAQDGINKAVII